MGEDFEAAPEELQGDAIALKEWARVVPLLRKVRMIAESDRAALVVLCQQYSRYIEAHGKVRSLGMVVKKGEDLITNPYLRISDQALKACVRLWVELGCSPSARSRVVALPDLEPGINKWA